MQAGEVMRGDVVTVSPDTAIEDAVRLMLDRHISGLPVIDDAGTAVGMVTEGDLLRRAELGTQKRISAWRAWLAASGSAARNYVQSHARRVGEVMTVPVIGVTPDTALADIVQLMETHRIKRLPVLEHGRVTGIVTRADLLRALMRELPSAQVAPVSDAQLRQRVLTALRQQPWARRDTSLDVRVNDGVVELVGVVTDPREREAIRVVAENTPGTRSVIDRLLWVEAMSGIPMDPPAGMSR
jgi:CBS-domain-containing membrane protein